MTNVGIFQFASSSIHLATSLEILKNELSDGSDNHYCFWANQTIFPNKMSKMAASIRHTTPKKSKN